MNGKAEKPRHYFRKVWIVDACDDDGRNYIIEIFDTEALANAFAVKLNHPRFKHANQVRVSPELVADDLFNPRFDTNGYYERQG